MTRRQLEPLRPLTDPELLQLDSAQSFLTHPSGPGRPLGRCFRWLLVPLTLMQLAWLEGAPAMLSPSWSPASTGKAWRRWFHGMGAGLLRSIRKRHASGFWRRSAGLPIGTRIAPPPGSSRPCAGQCAVPQMGCPRSVL
jgi:hypothetical protein